MAPLSNSSHSTSEFSQSSTNSDSYTLSSISMGTGSTPHKNRAANMAPDSNAKQMNDALLDDLTGHVYPAIPVKDFVEKVWKLHVETANKVLTGPLDFNQGLFEAYAKIANNPSANEKELHAPFRYFSWQLLHDICTKLNRNYSDLNTCFWDKNGTQDITRQINNESEVDRRPDMLEIFIPQDIQDQTCTKLVDPATADVTNFNPGISWGEVRCTLEFKKRRPAKGHPKSAQVKNKTTRASSKNTSNVGLSSSMLAGPSTSRGATSSFASSSTRLIASNIDTNASSNGKRASSAAGLDDTDLPSKKVRTSGKTTQNDAQLARYALETLIPGMRHYTTGILIDRFQVAVWYYDRTAIIHTVEFDFSNVEGIKCLGLVLFALSQATMEAAGFDPHIHKFNPPETGKIVKQENIVTLEKPEVSLVSDSSNLCFKFQSSIGDGHEWVFPVKDLILQYRGLLGRGTLVAGVKASPVGKVLLDVDRVLKSSWQYSGRLHEADIILLLRERIPNWKKHLPDPVFYATIPSTNLPLSRLKDDLKLKSDGPEIIDRNRHVLVTSRFKQLWDAKDVEEFKRVFLDCLECHYHACNTGNVLHRDISENNLMISRPEDSTANVPSKSKTTELSRGILNDFDMAALLNTALSTADAQHHLTGTVPFMALELLNKYHPCMGHIYRYDLESFYYLLIWAAIHYDLSSEEPFRLEKTPPGCTLTEWNHPEDNRAYNHKALLDMNYLFQFIRPGWEAVWFEWIEPLSDMFKKGHSQIESNFQEKTRAARRHQKASEEAEKFNHETCNGVLTFQNFMDVIGVTPRGLDYKCRD